MEYLCRYFGDGFLGLIGESHHGPLLAGRGSPLCVSVAHGLTTAASVAALAAANLDPVQACPHRRHTAANTAEACTSEPCCQANCLASVLPAVPVGLTCVCTAATCSSIAHIHGSTFQCTLLMNINSKITLL